MAKPRILIFSTAYFPFVGGAEVAVRELTDRLVNYDFDLITARLDRSLSKHEQIGRVNVYRLGIGWSLADKLLLPLIGAIFISKLKKQNEYLAFWCIMATFASGAAYIFNIFSSKPTPIVLTLQEGDSETHLKRRWFGLIGLSWRLALPRTTELTVISNYLADLAKQFGYKKSAHLVPNGVDLEKFKPADINFDKKVIITTSRLVPKNGVSDLIAALTFLPTDVTLQVYGEGYLQNTLESQVRDLGLTDRVTFFGHLAPNDLPTKLAAASIFCRPSLSEGQGISFLEAMAVGLPTIGTSVGGIPDFLKENETGWLAEPKNPESIAKQISFILNPQNRDRVLAISKAGQELMTQKYSWTDIAGKMGQILAGLTNGRPV